MPTFLEFWSFVLFGPASVTGPFFEYSDYQNFIEFKGVYSKLPRGLKDGLMSVKPAFIRFLYTCGCMIPQVVFFQILGWVPEHVGSVEFVNEGSLLWRLFFVQVTATAQRFVYYFTWSFSDAACIASGISFNGFDKDGNATWDRIYNVCVWDFEFDPSVPVKARAWNHQIHLWLKRYIGERLVEPGQKLDVRNELLTYLVSAWWHGIYPFYTILFFYIGLQNVINKQLYKARDRLPNIPYGGAVANLLNMFFVNYQGMSFTLLTGEKMWNFTKATMGLGWILPPLILVLINALRLN